jgi:hypothetical protein
MLACQRNHRAEEKDPMSQIAIGEDIIDVEDCVRRGAEPRTGAQYRIKVGNDRLEYETYVVADPVPTGAQILTASGHRPVAGHILIAVLRDGGLEEIRPDETVEIFRRGVERFIAFRSDRSFRFVLNDRRLEWGANSILGRVLKLLAGLDPAKSGAWLERRDELDMLVEDDQLVSLAGKEVERFRAAPVFILCIEGDSHRWLKSTITMEEIAALGGWDPSQGVIEVDKDQNERQLKPGEVITLKPGFSYGKKLCWKRG